MTQAVKIFSPIQPRQIKLIHIAKAQLKMTEQNYRDTLSGYKNEKTGSQIASSKELSLRQAEDLLSVFEKIGFKKFTKSSNRKFSPGFGKEKYKELKGRSSEFALPSQLRKIEAVWREHSREKSDDSLQRFLEHKYNYSLITSVLQKDVHKIVKAIKSLKVKSSKVEK